MKSVKIYEYWMVTTSWVPMCASLTLDIGVSGQANCIHSFASALLQLYILCVGDTHKLCQVFSKLLNDIERFFNSRPT